MVILKEYEIYLKVKALIEAENCDENELIPKLVNRIGIIPTYIPLIIEPRTRNELNITLYLLLLRVVAFLNKRLFMPIGIEKRE